MTADPPIAHALSITGSMTWAITWAPILGFTLSAAALIVRFVRTGGLAMLRMMVGAPDTHDY
jgi:hypothetical protein